MPANEIYLDSIIEGANILKTRLDSCTLGIKEIDKKLIDTTLKTVDKIVWDMVDTIDENG